MKRFYLKVTLFGLLLLFCVMFGVSLASSGVERVSGPLAGAAGAAGGAIKTAGSAGAAAAGRVKAGAGAEAKGGVKAASANSQSTAKDAAGKSGAAGKAGAAGGGVKAKTDDVQPHAGKDAALNQVGNKLGDLLQIMAHHGIRAFIGVFDSVLGKG